MIFYVCIFSHTVVHLVSTIFFENRKVVLVKLKHVLTVCTMLVFYPLSSIWLLTKSLIMRTGTTLLLHEDLGCEVRRKKKEVEKNGKNKIYLFIYIK